MHSPVYEDRLEAGASITYIANTSSGTESSGLTVYKPLEAKILAVHKEVGSDPYYSVSITEAESSASSSGEGRLTRELQTEWYK